MVDLDFKREIEGVRKWYDSIANNFVSRYEGKGGEYLRIFEEDVLVGLIRPGKSILDLGCGHGRFASRMKRRGEKKVFAVDISMEMLKRSKDQDLPKIQANAVELPFKDSSFDTVVSMGMFEYLHDPMPFIIEINRVLKSKGELFLTFHQIRGLQKSLKEDGESLYFGRKIRERDALWKRATRTLGEMKMYLLKSGFKTEKVRRVFFRFPAFLFGTGFEIRSRFMILGKEVILLSKIAENFLSALFSERSTGNTMIMARKIS